MKRKAKPKDRIKTNKNNRASIKNRKIKRQTNRNEIETETKMTRTFTKTKEISNNNKKPTYKMNERTKQRKRAKCAGKNFVQNSLTWSLTVLKVFRIFVFSFMFCQAHQNFVYVCIYIVTRERSRPYAACRGKSMRTGRANYSKCAKITTTTTNK